jgi:hypothetical protein
LVFLLNEEYGRHVGGIGLRERISENRNNLVASTLLFCHKQSLGIDASFVQDFLVVFSKPKTI